MPSAEPVTRACMHTRPQLLFCRRRLAEAAARSLAERAQDDAVTREAMRRAAAEEAREAELKAKRKAEASSYRCAEFANQAAHGLRTPRTEPQPRNTAPC